MFRYIATTRTVGSRMSIYLHFIGEKTYPRDSDFIAEAVKKGAQRACSYRLLKQMVNEAAVIYYARYESGKARVFAKGKVIGVSTDYPLSLGDNEHTKWRYESRGCGSYLTKTWQVEDLQGFLEDLEYREGADKLAKWKWFLNTDIESYNTLIMYLISYTKQGMNVKQIQFTRGFIKLYGKGSERRGWVAKELAQYKKDKRRRNKSILYDYQPMTLDIYYRAM